MKQLMPTRRLCEGGRHLDIPSDHESLREAARKLNAILLWPEGASQGGGHAALCTMLVPICEAPCCALAGNAGRVKAWQVVRALAGPLARARCMKMEPPATRTSRRTDKTIGCGGRFQFELMAALHTRGVSFLYICSANAGLSG